MTVVHPRAFEQLLSPQPVPVARTAAAAPTRIGVLVRLAFYLFVLSIPFEMPDRTFPIEIPTLTGCIFLLSTVLNFSVIYRRIPAALLWFVAYLWCFGLSTMWNRADHVAQVAELFGEFAQLLLILWAGSNVLRDPRAMRGALLMFAFACALRAGMQVLGIAASEHAEWTGGYRVTVLGQNPNYSAIILSAGFVTVLNLRLKILAWLVAGVIGLALIQTGSRGGLFCAAVGTLALLWHGRTMFARLRGVFVGFLALTALGIAAYRSPMLRVRFEAAFTQGSLAGRERIYPAVLSMIQERPLLGWGPIENQYEIAQRIGEEAKDRRDAHNMLFELFSTVGIVGTIPFLVGLALCLREAWRARKGPLEMLPIALLVTVLIGCISGTWIASKMLWFAFAVAVGAGAAIPRRSSSCAA